MVSAEISVSGIWWDPTRAGITTAECFSPPPAAGSAECESPLCENIRLVEDVMDVGVGSIMTQQKTPTKLISSSLHQLTGEHRGGRT